MTKVKQQSNKSKKCCSSIIYSFIGFISGKKKSYSIVKDSSSLDITIVAATATATVIEKQPKEMWIPPPKSEREYKQYHFKGEIILVANDNLRFQEWLRQVEISK